MLRRKPVITGAGIIGAAGCGVVEVWDAIRCGRSGLGPLTLFPSPRYGHHRVGQVRQNVDALAGPVRGSRSDKLAWIAAQEARASAGLTSCRDTLRPDRLGMILGSTVGGMLGTEQFLIRLLREDRRHFGPLRFHECATSTDLCAERLGLRGPSTTFSTACSAGAMAIAAAAELIKDGEADLILAGGSDSLCRLTLNGFGSLLLLDPNGCRPFDAKRVGISLGEGAAILVLEAEETARTRGAHILARLSGWGASCDAWHATAPHPEGDGAVAAMQRALQSSGLQPREIDYVSAHGTGTPDNDAMEAKALKRLFGARLPLISSTKRFFGHTLAASGAIKAVLCLKALQEQAVPPNAGLENADPSLGFEPVKQFRLHRLTHILSNSFGFGGNNVALIFSQAGAVASQSQSARLTTSASAATARRHRYAVLGVGVVSAAGSSLAEVQAAFRNGGAVPTYVEVATALTRGRTRVYASRESGTEHVIDPLKRRRLSRLQQMLIAAARRSLPTESLGSISPDRICLAIGTGLGSLSDTAAFVENMVAKEERAPRPAHFTNSVHNALAAQVAIELHITGLNSTPTHREISFETALWHGGRELACGQADLALVGAAEELSPYVLATGLRWRWWNEQTPPIGPFSHSLNGRQRPLPGEGAVVIALGNLTNAPHPLAWVSGLRIGRWATLGEARMDAAAEAQWIRETLERDGGSLAGVDLLLTGANGRPSIDRSYLAVADALSQLAGRSIPCGAYKHACGEYYSASAFGFLTALMFSSGELEPAHCLCALDRGTPRDGPGRTVVLYTLSPTGTKGMCCVSP